ncbi:MAG TPA: hypothetical protein ENN51_03920 [candidate division WOR-3 bacterium]|uniref:Translocation and assembly module TamB C-terminal domain-containing protein n=1 Tax=candidate division WOR-3 bacterium TaxID=2052148 RepID=A0A7V0T5W9_UNCW3|nr:hypothetical protein [candidate division WOR-3 bacterium]
MPSKPARRGRGCLVTLLVLLLAAGAGFLLRQPIARFAVNVAVGYLARSLDARVEYESIEGDIFSHPTVVGLRVHLNGDSLRVGRVTMRYAPLGFLFGRIPVSELEVVRPELFFAALPGPDTAPPAEDRPVSLPRLELDRLTIEDGRIYLADTLRVDSLELVASGRSTPQSAVVELLTLRAVATREELGLRRLSARARLTPRTLVLEELDLRTDRSQLRGEARFAFENGGVHLELERLTLDLAELTGPLELSPGEVQGMFRARGEAGLGADRRTARLDFSTAALGFEGVRLPDLTGNLRFDDPVLRLDVSGRDSALGEFVLDGSLNRENLRFSVRGRFRGIRAAGFDPTLPDLVLDADLSATGTGLERVEADIGGRVPGLGIDTFRLAGGRDRDRVEVTRFDATGRSGRVQASGSWSAGGRVRGEALFTDLDVGPFVQLAGVTAAGRLSGLLQAEGTADSLAVAGGLRLREFEFDDLHLGAAVFHADAVVGRGLHGRVAVGAEEIRWGEMEVSAAQLTLLDTEFDIRVERPLDRLTARGTHELTRDRLRLAVAGFEFATARETLALVEPFGVDWSADSLAVRGVRYEVADGTVEFDLLQSGAAGPQLELSARGLNLARVRELLSLDFELEGTADLSVTGRDTLAGKLLLTDLAVPGMRMALRHTVLDLRLLLSGPEGAGRLFVDGLRFVHDRDTSVITGHADFTTRDSFALVGVDITAVLADPGAWPLAFLQGIVDLRSGTIYGTLGLRGDLATPELSGRVRISRGQLWVPALNTMLERVNAEITANRGRVNLEKVAGAAGTGVVTAEGFLEFGRDWQLDTLALLIRSEDAVIRPLPEVHAVVSGDVRLALAPGRPFSIEGDLWAREALVTVGFGNEAPPTAPAPGEDSVVFDLRIRAERGVWLRNRMADIELSLDLSLRKTMQDETWTGHLSTRQGNIYYLDRTLRVTRGEIMFQSIGSLDPDLDIVAELPVRARNGDGGVLPERILLTLGGTLNRPEFRFSSEPMVWDENEIITYLSLDVTPAEYDAFDNREAIARYLSGRLLGFAQTQFTKQVRQWLTVDALRFESELTGGEGQRVTVGKYVGRDLYITYTQNFTGEMLPEFRVEYYIDRRNEVIGERNDQGRFSVRYRHRLRY